MPVFKCKMCGGTLEIQPEATVAVCDSCGTKQTLPKIDDDRRANLYDRANHFRRSNEFDKAMAIYEQILNEDNADAEAYWSLVLCRYGIEYVEDPVTHKRVPTVNRAQFTSVFDDVDYKSALQYADDYQRSVYQEEATAINDIQKGILAISQKEEPFDVFICYKETDDSGRRTQDSVLANDLYHQLTSEGFKVFFSRITLEDKLGTAYEPYIFAALNSAKIMVVIGTRPEYFNAVWVKNEWSRFLMLMKNGAEKLLIPAYRDMDPYDLPEEFSHLQAQDMSKLGFMQDLIRGIKKLTGANQAQPTAKETVVVSSGNMDIEPLLKRAFLFLEDGDFESADDYCEKVLDRDPECAQAYVGKLLAELHVKKQEQLPEYAKAFDTSDNYRKAMRFGDKQLQNTLEGYRQERLYRLAVQKMKAANDENTYQSAMIAFQAIPGYKDADRLQEQCREKAEEYKKEVQYQGARKNMKFYTEDSVGKALSQFEKLSGYKDADQQAAACREKLQQLKAERERRIAEREQRKREQQIAEEKHDKRMKIIGLVVIGIFIFSISGCYLLFPVINYNRANAEMKAGNYGAAVTAFTKIEDYKDSAELLKEAQYNLAKSQISTGNYSDAITLFEKLNNYKDSDELLKEAKYQKALFLLEDEKYAGAAAVFNTLGDYKDAKDLLKRARDQTATTSKNITNADSGNSANYNVYENTEFGITCPYPKAFRASGGYSVLKNLSASDDSATMRIDAIYNSRNLSTQQVMQNYIDASLSKVTYKANGETWFVVSFGDASYRKCFVKNGKIAWFDFSFDKNSINADSYRANIEYIENHFRMD